jgi:hypothetical protein
MMTTNVISVPMRAPHRISASAIRTILQTSAEMCQKHFEANSSNHNPCQASKNSNSSATNIATQMTELRVLEEFHLAWSALLLALPAGPQLAWCLALW